MKLFIQKTGAASSAAFVKVNTTGASSSDVARILVDITGERQMQEGVWVPANISKDKASYYAVSDGVNYETNILMNGWGFYR